MTPRCTIGLCPICRESLLRKNRPILGATSTTENDFPLELLHKSPAALNREQRDRRDKFVKLITSNTSNNSNRKGGGISVANANLQQLYQQSIKEAVVSTKCGHVFHKYCLREYCQSFRQLRKRGLVECPICKQHIIMSGTIELDLRILQRYNQVTDGNYKLAEIMNVELKSQSVPLKSKNEALIINIEEQTALLRALEHQADKIQKKWLQKRIIYKEYKEVVQKLTRIEHEENVLQIENRNLTKIYLTLLTIGPMIPILLDPRIPHKLIPYFSAILQHPELYDPFREILVPLMSNQAHLQPSDLVDGIIEIVRLRRNNNITTAENTDDDNNGPTTTFVSEPNSSPTSSIIDLNHHHHHQNHHGHSYSRY